MTAATSAKMAIEIPETNQKTKSIRSASFEAGVGNQGRKNATMNATAAAARPTATRRTSTPLRTAASLLNPPLHRRLRTSVTSGRFQPWSRGYNDDRAGYERGP